VPNDAACRDASTTDPATILHPAGRDCVSQKFAACSWEDYTGDFLHVRRKVWNTHTGQAKTVESKNAVPVAIPALRRLLDEPRATANGAVWIFTGPKLGFALHLDNLGRREILLVLGDKSWVAKLPAVAWTPICSGWALRPKLCKRYCGTQMQPRLASITFC
jgi:hypothetical protein